MGSDAPPTLVRWFCRGKIADLCTCCNIPQYRVVHLALFTRELEAGVVFALVVLGRIVFTQKSKATLENFKALPCLP
jgi:hypothetical protein